MRRLAVVVLGVSIGAAAASSTVAAWGGQGHRLIGLIAANHLTPAAKQNVAWLLGRQSLADVASWADGIRNDQQQTGLWHYADIPREAAGYDRDRDCPRQAGVAAGTRGDTWRDCAVDRIIFFEQRTADAALDRADRATALKYLVHFVGDLHQPFHGLEHARGGNDVHVKVFGTADCGRDPARPFPCNLHSVWDSMLLERRGLDDAASVAMLEKLIASRGWLTTPPGTPADWAVESWQRAKVALVANDASIDEAYYKAQIPVIDERLARAGARLAQVLNRVFVAPPPAN